MLYAIVALLVIVLDQWTKLWVSTNANLLPYTLVPNTISLVNAQNPGGAFGFLADKNATVIFIAVAGAIALLTIIALSTNLIKGGLGRWCLVFISAGGLSNAIDRLMSQGKVQDMIKLDFLERVKIFGLKGINFPIFNVADIFITVFCFLLILYILFGGNKKAAVRELDVEEEPEDEELLEDEEEEEEEEDAPVRRREKKQRRGEKAEPEPKPAKRSQGYEEDYERYKARKAREEQPAPAAEPAAPVVDPQDPFAEWERANQKAGAPAPVEAPKAAEAPKPAPAPAPAPAVEQPKPAPKPASSDEFSLEDILAEFR